jgi:hypothetical protein
MARMESAANLCVGLSARLGLEPATARATTTAAIVVGAAARLAQRRTARVPERQALFLHFLIHRGCMADARTTRNVQGKIA